MWKPKLRTWADKFFWTVVGIAAVGLLGLIGHVILALFDLNIETLATKEGWNNALSDLWPKVMSWGASHTIFLLAAACFLGGGAICLAVYRALVPIDRPNKKNPEEIRRIGADCTALSESMFRFLSERASERVGRHIGPQPQDPKEAWQADRDFEAVTSAQFFTRFGAQAVFNLGRLQRLGISSPPHIVTTAQHGHPNGLAQFLGLIGGFLKEGELEEAIEVCYDRNFIWQIQH